MKLDNYEIPKCLKPNCNKNASLFGELGFNKKPMFLKTCAKHYINCNILPSKQLELSL